MKKILHICTDEKFIDFAINNFNEIKSVSNHFVVVSSNKKLKCVKSQNVIVLSKWQFFIKILIGDLKNYNALIFHSIDEASKLFLKFIPKKIKICWIGFGFDYYDNNLLSGNYKQRKRWKYYIKKYILNLDASYQKINYFCPVLESEFNNVVSRLNLNAEYIDWNYGSSDKVIEALKSKFVSGNSILLGNSATETNRHLEVIQKLDKNNEQREIIIPLSYGDSIYASMLEEELKKTKLNYLLLTDFMSQDDYFDILKSCSFVIMNHSRQQAAGNIATMLSLGAKVILDKENPLYDYFLNMGFKIYNNKNLSTLLLTPLPEKDKKLNKDIALRNFNSNMTLEKTKVLINKL